MKIDVLEFLVRSGALRFGEFTTKSGRTSPYFVDLGRVGTGAQLAKLGEFYARAIHDRFEGRFDVLFGPAYKGIPLVVATAIHYARAFGVDVGYAFNRKEGKDHGEGGVLVGHPMKDGDRVLVVEDVTTAGTSIRETVPLLQRAARVEVVGLVVAVDRQERGPGGRSALAELAEQFAFEILALVRLEDMLELLEGRRVDGELVLTPERARGLAAYRERFGAPQERS